MVRTLLPPGFRFHPTDVELVMYYLKKKIMGKHHFEAIAEVNIYKFSPSDLPDKSCLKSKDLEWYFFCPREMKYASGARVKRATENGYWKTTGKDRPIRINDKTVGTVKTLVFHIGHAPGGDRTDWVIHEYRILDDQLAAAGLQDTYVLCKVFKKSGPGPKNGAQYGAPFNEEEWSDDDDDVLAQLETVPTTIDVPLPTTLLLQEKQTCPPVKDLLFPGSTSGLSSADGRLPSPGISSIEVPAEETRDDMVRLLAQFTDEGTFPFDENITNKGELVDKGKNKCLSCPDDVYEIYNNLGDLDSGFWMSDGQFDFSEMMNDGFSLDELPQDDSGYIEINDLQTPLNDLSGAVGADYSPVINMFKSYNQTNVEQLHSDNCSVRTNQYVTCANQLPVLPNELYKVDSFAGVPQMFNGQFHDRSESSHVFNEQPFNMAKFTQDIKGGRCADNP